MWFSFREIAVGLVVFATMTCGEQAWAAIKLNDPQFFGARVRGIPLISPDSSRVVFYGDQEAGNVFELFSVSSIGGTVTKLNGSLSAIGGNVGDQFSGGHFLSPDGTRVAYLANQDTDNVVELYSVPIGGGTATKLNDTMAEGGNVPIVDIPYLFSPDSSRVVYRADQDANGVFELFSVASIGGAVTKLNNTMVTGGDITDGNFLVSPDNSHVVYRADQDANNIFELYSVPLAGGIAMKLNNTLVGGGDVGKGTFAITPDSSRVVYRADQDIDGVDELYSVPLSGGVVTKLNGSLVVGGDTGGPKIDSNSSSVVYRADQDVNDVLELYSVPLSGGSVTKISGALTTGGDASSSVISPDGSRVVYLADQDANDVLELYSVPIGGGTVTKLNDTLVAGGNVAKGHLISPDSKFVIFFADADTDTVTELYSVPIDGGPVTKLNDTIVVGGEILSDSLQITMDSNLVVYIADQDTLDVNELYAVPIAGGTVTKLNGPMVADGGVLEQFGGYALSPDNSFVVYVGQQKTDITSELYRADLPVVSITGDCDGDGDVDGDDFLAWQNGFPISAGAVLLDGDADEDGDVDGDDFLVWQNNFPYPAALSSVPEPASLVLLALGVTGVLAYRHRRIQLGW